LCHQWRSRCTPIESEEVTHMDEVAPPSSLPWGGDTQHPTPWPSLRRFGRLQYTTAPRKECRAQSRCHCWDALEPSELLGGEATAPCLIAECNGHQPWHHTPPPSGFNPHPMESPITPNSNTTTKNLGGLTGESPSSSNPPLSLLTLRHDRGKYDHGGTHQGQAKSPHFV
jgi:hypothetical protein